MLYYHVPATCCVDLAAYTNSSLCPLTTIHTCLPLVLRSSLSCCVHALTKLLPCVHTYTGLPEGSRDTAGVVLSPEGRARHLDGHAGQTHPPLSAFYIHSRVLCLLSFWLPHAQTTNVKNETKASEAFETMSVHVTLSYGYHPCVNSSLLITANCSFRNLQLRRCYVLQYAYRFSFCVVCVEYWVLGGLTL